VISGAAKDDMVAVLVRASAIGFGIIVLHPKLGNRKSKYCRVKPIHVLADMFQKVIVL